MVAYADTSAAIKLAHREEHSEALVAWLNEQQDLAVVSSVLLEVELTRALHRYDPAALPQAAEVVGRFFRIELNHDIRTIAGAYQWPLLRSLDAIHLATVRYLASTGTGVDAFLAYDRRLTELARAEGLSVLSPGQPA